MATYIYETIPEKESEGPRRFEIQQSMKEDPLTHDPISGLPVKRVITGGYGFVSAPRDSGIGQPTTIQDSPLCHRGIRIRLQ